MADPQKGQAIVKAITKAALRALFSIGVKSPYYVDRFVVAFSEAIEEEWNKLPVEPTEPVQQNQVTKEEDNLALIIENTMIQKALRKAGIDTIEKLITKGQQDDYVSIKGIGRKSADDITERIKKWNQLQS